MASNKLILTLALMLLIASAVGPLATKAITCNQVTSSLRQCVTYLRTGGSPTSSCCKGIVNLNKAANSSAARKDTCNCLKSLYKSVKGIKLGPAKALPGKCKVKISYSIDPNINCGNL